MRSQIEARLREVYADGYLDRPNTRAYYGQELRKRLHVVADAVAERPRFVLNERMNLTREGAYELAVTEAAYPSLWEGWNGATNDARRAWLDANGGMYPVLWLQVSRVWPALSYYFNLWQKRGDTSQLDAKLVDRAPDEGWRELLAAVVVALNGAGIETLSSEELLEPVPFVLDLVWPENGEQDVWDDELDPVEEPSNVGQCLFQPY
jgi:hypothetical protein